MTVYYEYSLIIENGQIAFINPFPTKSDVTLTGSGATPNILGDKADESFTATKGSSSTSFTYFGNTTSLFFPALHGLIGTDADGNNFLFLPDTGTNGLLEGLESLLISKTADNTGNAHTWWNIDQAIPHCFLAGTRIATPDGDVAVESLRAGDLVLTADERVAPIRWLGHSTVARALADPLKIMPVRIKAGALAANTPHRDLLLSPDHAILLDDVLVQAAALENGASILRETQMPLFFTYYHIELADHALVLAEGVPSETFIDNVDRFAFDNWAEHEALLGDTAPIAEMPYPRAQAARQVPTHIRDRLTTRAEKLFGALVG